MRPAWRDRAPDSGSPAELFNGASPGRRAQLGAAASDRREAHDGRRKRVRDRADRRAGLRGRRGTMRVSRSIRGATTGKPRRHVLEDFQRRPVELARKRRMRRDIERRDPDIGSREDCRDRLVRQRTSEGDAVEPCAALRTRTSSGPSPMSTALMSRRPRARSARIASTR